jgi:hypothetical protein
VSAPRMARKDQYSWKSFMGFLLRIKSPLDAWAIM